MGSYSTAKDLGFGHTRGRPKRASEAELLARFLHAASLVLKPLPGAYF